MAKVARLMMAKTARSKFAGRTLISAPLASASIRYRPTAETRRSQASPGGSTVNISAVRTETTTVETKK